MNNEQFIYWLKGYIDGDNIDVDIIKKEIDKIIPYNISYAVPSVVPYVVPVYPCPMPIIDYVITS